MENRVINNKKWKTLWKTLRKAEKADKSKEEAATMTRDSVYWTCPYYKNEDALGVHCEGGRVKLPSGEAERDYIRTYCADHLGWKRCSVSRAVTRFYEKLYADAAE